MIEGVVNAAREAVVTLSIHGPVGQTVEIESVVDTGFTGFLTLPPDLVTKLALPFVAGGWAMLADGSEVPFDTYRVTVLWEGQPREILVDEADILSLLGMALLDRHTLTIEVESGGRVVIEARG